MHATRLQLKSRLHDISRSQPSQEVALPVLFCIPFPWIKWKPAEKHCVQDYATRPYVRRLAIIFAPHCVQHLRSCKQDYAACHESVSQECVGCLMVKLSKHGKRLDAPVYSGVPTAVSGALWSVLMEYPKSHIFRRGLNSELLSRMFSSLMSLFAMPILHREARLHLCCAAVNCVAELHCLHSYRPYCCAACWPHLVSLLSLPMHVVHSQYQLLEQPSSLVF